MSDPRRLGAAALAAIPVYLALSLFTSPGGASAATHALGLPSPSPVVTPTGDSTSSSGSSGVLPSPTPCPSSSPTPTPLLGLGGCSTPTPPPTPGATPQPSGGSSPSASASPSQGSAAGGAGGQGSNRPPGSAAGQPTVVPGTLVIADPLLAAEVQAVLQNPVSKQRPDLLHFQPTSASIGAGPGGAPTSGGSGGRGGAGGAAGVAIAAGVVAALLAGLCLVLILRDRGGAWRLRPGLARTTLLGAAPFAAAVVLIAANGPVAPASAGARALPVAAPQHGSLMAALRSHARSIPLTTANTTWTSLVAIETALDAQHDRLVADEQLIATATQELADAASSGAAQHSERPGYVAVLKQVLQLAVTDHANFVTAYTTSLDNEYTFFVSAAQSPQAATALQAVASHTTPDVRTAVTTDLSMVQTQLQQEAQIASAAGTDSSLSLTGPITFHAPLSGVVTQAFGPTQFSLEPPVTYHGVFYPHFHTGLDIAAPLDTPVGAAAAGKVILATSSVDSNGKLVGYGNYVVIDHGDGFLTLYGHLDRLLVTAGQIVKQGQVIGLCGSTGWSTGPHVHFEIRKSGVYTDPAPYLAAQLKP